MLLLKNACETGVEAVRHQADFFQFRTEPRLLKKSRMNMSVPSKIHNIQLVKIQPEERLATTSELNLASCLVTGSGEARD